MLQVFESHAECLSPYLFSLYAFPHLEEIAVRVKQRLGKDAVPMVSHSIDFRTWEDEWKYVEL
jgi:uroporphyrinogen-III decarboxylase